ncbi:MAG: zinc-dependent peptidase [Saprospiraceae bacterium]|nr:zinc-dependent peptidase [Saprospiraceae bacterium]
MTFWIIGAVGVLAIALVTTNWRRVTWEMPDEPFPNKWRSILVKEIDFYNGLTPPEKKTFEFKVQEFLLNCRITGIETTVDLTDRLMVASSAVIPILKFPKWHYTNLFEVLLYPKSFNEDFETTGQDRRILGMVGSGFMNGKMILSKQALHHGFDNRSDKKNTAIHEFVHLIDKLDGNIDGVPSLLLEQPCIIPWIDLMSQKIEEIHEDESDINPYGGTSKVEFFAVVSEYFFERPRLLAKKHPELYDMLEEIFDHDMEKRPLNRKKQSLGRNSPCPCGSGKKFKHCCGKQHY